MRVTPVGSGMTVSLTCEGKNYKMDRVGTQWSVLLQNITEGNHVIDIKPEGAQSHQFTIKVVGLSGNSDINEFIEL